MSALSAPAGHLPLEGKANDTKATLISKIAALLIFMRRTTPALPSEPVEPAKPLSQTIKGRCAPWAKFESRD